VVDGGVVKIEMSSVTDNRGGRNAAAFSLDYAHDACTHGDQPGQHITWDFGDRRVNVTQYSIMSYQRPHPGGTHLKSWRIEASLDKENWKVLDDKKDRMELAGPCKIGTFDVAKPTVCRYLRLVSTGPNHRHGTSHCLVIAGMELFGLLIDCQ
jgi:hypothetical protein